MARIDKTEHARILRLVDEDGRKVAEVAAEYGCTPANIYALLGRLRRGAGDAEPGAATPSTPEPGPEANPPAARATRRGRVPRGNATEGGAGEEPTAPRRRSPSAEGEPPPRAALELTPPASQAGRASRTVRPPARPSPTGGRVTREHAATPPEATGEPDAPDGDLFAAPGATDLFAAPAGSSADAPAAAGDAEVRPPASPLPAERAVRMDEGAPSGTPGEEAPAAEPARSEGSRRQNPPVQAAKPPPGGRTGRTSGAGAGRDAPVGARLAKFGFGLVMRMDDGEESLTPFRSLEDLLSAVKPILRTAARSPDPVWFSIRPVDLASVDLEG